MSHQQDIAMKAAETAGPFANLLADRYSQIATRLRNGDDGPALDALGASAEDLEHFLQFLILVQDMVSATPENDVASALLDYREHIVDIVEGLAPALGHLDFVEVADAIEEDLVPSLRDYGSLDQRIIDTLHVAA